MKSEYNLAIMIYQFQNEICYYSKLQLLSTCPYEQLHYESLIMRRTEEIINLLGVVGSKSNENIPVFQRQKEFSLEELSIYDGANGRAAYVAVNGTVYDMSKESAWAGGTHFGIFAGKDLSGDFMSCHKGMLELLNKLPKVGILKK